MSSSGDPAAVTAAGPALAVFHGHGTGPFAPLLKRDFAHVFVAIRHDGYWIAFDGRDGMPQIEVVADACHDLAAHYRACGFTVVKLDRRGGRPALPLMLATCVGAAKRLLGVRRPWVLTPYQLYRHLQNHSERREPCVDAA